MFTVILIDDEEIIRKGLRKMIPWEELGCEIVAEASNGEEGFEMIKEHVPDIIISDIRMPKKNGLEMIALIKELNQDTEIIILTGFREFEYAQEAIRLGVSHFLLKPSKIPEIKEAVEEAVDNLKTKEKEEERLQQIKEKARKYYTTQPQEIDTNIDPREGRGIAEDKPQFIVNQAVKYIHDNYDQKLSLKIVAEDLYVSTWHLCKVLKKETGSNFVDILNGVRINKAKEMLVTTNLRIYEIAAKCGYSDTAYFSKIFKRFEGITPNEYRNTQYCTTNNKLDSF